MEPEEQGRIAQYDRQLEEIKKEAEEKEHASHAHLHKHETYARGVTMFQVAIAVAAIAVLTKLRSFWLVGLGFSVVGIFFLDSGVSGEVAGARRSPLSSCKAVALAMFRPRRSRGHSSVGRAPQWH